MHLRLLAWVCLLVACSGSPDGLGPNGSASPNADGPASPDTAAEAAWCPATPHDPAVPVAGYDEHPVFIQGTDQRFVSIQHGIEGAAAGEVVVVCPGVYRENIDFEGKIIRLTSLAGPNQTVIDGGGTLSTVSLRNGEPAETVLEGFTVQGGEGSGAHGGGISVEGAAPTIRYNVVSANRAGRGGGVSVREGNATVHNNVIVGNDARDGGGGLSCSACAGSFRYNTLVANTARDGHAGEYAGGAADFVGNLLVAREGEDGYALRVVDWSEDQDFVISHNLLWPDGFDWAGSGDGYRWDEVSEEALRADPLFEDSAAGNYRLVLSSPARDAGPPDDTDPDGSRADLGAYGGPDGDWPWN